MATIRAVLFSLFQLVTVIPVAFLCLLCAPFPLSWRYKVTITWPAMVVWAARVILGIRWRVIGAENLPEGRAILLSKHQSTWETMFLMAHMPREMVFVFKRELLFVPFFGWGIWLLDMIHIDRRRGTDAFESVVTQGEKRLAEGRWIVMFPEGTRTRVGGQGRYKSGGARLAVRTGTPVVPIAVNSGERWPKGVFHKTPGLITVSIGKPIPTQGREPDQVNREVEAWIEGEMRRLSPQVYA